MVNTNSLIKIPAMTIGAAGAVLSAYSIVKDGNAKARCETKEELGKAYVDMSVKNLSSSRESHLLEKIKNYVTKQRLDNSFYPFLLQAKNHVINWIGETAENIVPITLSAIAIGVPILFKKPKINTSTTLAVNNSAIKVPLLKRLRYLPYAEKLGTSVAAISAGLLLLGSGKFFVHDVLGIGKTKEY
jgi:hypothetical protein